MKFLDSARWFTSDLTDLLATDSYMHRHNCLLFFLLARHMAMCAVMHTRVCMLIKT